MLSICRKTGHCFIAINRDARDKPVCLRRHCMEVLCYIKVQRLGAATADWSVIALDRPVDAIWIKAVRRLDTVEIFYSFDDREYIMMRNAWIEVCHPVKIGMFAACPDGDGFKATFSNFTVKHLPDKVRTDRLKNNAE